MSYQNPAMTALGTAAAALMLCVCATAQPIVLECDPAQTQASFALSATLHAVHGSFQLRHCAVRFDPATQKISGDIVFDATSGLTGNDRRDHKMHKDVLESGRYPDITFHPDRVEGNVNRQGTSRVQVHGLFGVHGAQHEIAVPVEVKLDGDHWGADARFPVPYVAWGMKNPSNLFLHVGDSVEVEFHGAGKLSAAH
jgi:polyisoprenoid-binding protein YceI